MYKIIRAKSSDLDSVAKLFDEYRVFYKQDSNINAAREFIKNRLHKNDSVIFLAIDDNTAEPLGFTQLYPSYSSVAMNHIWILNDLFVINKTRRQGIANALINEAEDFAKSDGATFITLATAENNITAQALYEKRKWNKDGFIHYKLSLKEK